MALGPRFSVIGAGRMAEAMLGGMFKIGLQAPTAVHIYDTNAARLAVCSSKWPGVHTHTSAAACVDGASVALLSVKPQHMQQVLSCISDALPSSAVAVSIAAGCPISMFAEGLRTEAICRAMPNTPAMVGEGGTVWTATDACSDEQRSQARQLLGCFGDEHYMHEEQYLDMATALVGSGPAYSYLFIEAMVDTGVHMGFPRETAERLVLKTVEGSVNYLKQSDRHIAALRNDISSPGGTTAAAIYEAERGGLRTVVSDSIWAAFRRSLELGGSCSNVGPGRSKSRWQGPE